jgi:DNA-binding NtrC family response regulator
MEDALHVLLVDDDRTQLELLSTICSSMEYPKVAWKTAESGAEAARALDAFQADLVLTDHHLPDSNGLEILGRVKQRNPGIAVVVMTAFENARDAVSLLKAGADDYLIKPTRAPDIQHLLLRVHERQTLRREEAAVRVEIEATFDPGSIVFRSRRFMEVLQVAARSAGSDTTVLITGESGTGKELIARLIHRTGARSERPFVTVNISALPEALVESELFGHRKGSFTGATEDRIGRFEEAHRGTVFIDEVGDVTPALQVKLLRVLQFGEMQRIGENATRTLDVRIIAATNRDLADMVKRGLFRADLFYRLNVIPIHVPPLRERREDVPALVDRFIGKANERHGRKITGIAREAMDALMRYPFPGNVRELENMVERAVVLSRTDMLLGRDFPDLAPATEAGGDGAGAAVEAAGAVEGSLTDTLRAIETRMITEALRAAGGNQSRAARALGISERHLRSRMEKLGLANAWKEP